MNNYELTLTKFQKRYFKSCHFKKEHTDKLIEDNIVEYKKIGNRHFWFVLNEKKLIKNYEKYFNKALPKNNNDNINRNIDLFLKRR